MQTNWSVDLGTTNTLVARWLGTHAETLNIEPICRSEPAWNTPLVPSVIFFEDLNRGYIGTKAEAADEITRLSYAGRLTPLARCFKRTLARDSGVAVASCGGASISARQCASVFLRMLLHEAADRERAMDGGIAGRYDALRRLIAWIRREGPIRDLTMTVPVESFEPYRMELQNITRRLGVQRFRVLDEPVAAALGYGLDLATDRTLLVVDFGGGTLDVALVRTRIGQLGPDGPRGPGSRRTELLAARGLALGGETIDEWVTDLACRMVGDRAEQWRPYLRVQAETVKQELSGKVLTTDNTFFRLPGGDMLAVERQDFLGILNERGLYRSIDQVTSACLEDAAHLIAPSDIEAVLLVGGSTLLPGIRDMFEQRFGAPRVHYWEPFEAVVKGAAIFGAGHFVDQIIHHDYAVRVFSEADQRPEYEILIRRGTPYPTPMGFQTRFYRAAPGQTQFSLPICEVGYAGRMSLDWKRRSNGHDYWLPQGSEEADCVVALNADDSLRLTPPGEPGHARLRVDFTVDSDRYLCATTHDLLRQKDIRVADRVVRLR